MSELNTESAAEASILAAVVESPTSQVERELPREPEEDPREAVRSTDEATEERAAEPEPEQTASQDEFIEIPGEDGAEPERVKIEDAVAAYRKQAEFERSLATVQEEVIGQARTQAVQMVTQTRAAVEQTQYMLQSILQHIAPPQPPAMDMLNAQSPTYNPDGYHLARAQFEQASQRYQEIQRASVMFQQQAEAARQFEDQQRRLQEDALLMRVWPESARDDVAEQVQRDLKRHYGITDDEIAAALTSHKHALIARDALAYRAMKEKAPEVQAKVQKAAPKIVRSRQEARAGSPQSRDSGGRFVNDALATLKKTNSDDAAAAYFAGLSRAGKL